MRPQLRLRKRLDEHLRAGHPWIYRDALDVRGPIPTGTVVEVLSQSGRFLARGLYDARSPIAFRVATLDAHEEVDEHLITRRMADALKARRGVFDARETNAFRWVNGEGDRLPGVVVDVYAETAVLRLDGEAVGAWRKDVLRAISELGQPRGIVHIVERSRHDKAVVLQGRPPAPVEILECGVRFGVDVLRGQKTGFFLDQRENRRLIRAYASGAEVANLFSYTGGFSVQAALGGARRVVSVDLAAPAIEAARANFALNGIDPKRHGFVAMDAFEWLDSTRAEGARFDLVIVDPPSFAPSEKSLAKALSAYRELNVAALGVVAPGGLLAAASCSSHVTLEAFLEMLTEAGVRARRPLRVLEVRGQPGDHPTPPVFSEGRYLKFVLLRAE